MHLIASSDAYIHYVLYIFKCWKNSRLQKTRPKVYRFGLRDKQKEEKKKKNRKKRIKKKRKKEKN